MISVKNLSFKYKNAQRKSISNINFDVKKGELVILLGSSGSGKTTITRVINGLVPEFYEGDFYGDIFIDGENTDDLYINDLSKIVGSVFQDPRSQFFATDTTAEVAFSCENSAIESTEIVKRITESAKLLDIEKLLERNIFHLSSGEKQLIAIASVCIYNPKIIVFDEPSANLDLSACNKLGNIIARLKNDGYTILISEHRIHYLKDLCDRAYFLENGEITKTFCNDDLFLKSNKELNELSIRSSVLEDIEYENVEDSYSSNQNANINYFTINNLSFAYDKKNPLYENLNFSTGQGNIIGIIGKNGVGKSTLLEIICGLKKADKGQICINSQPLSAKKRVKQSYLVMQDSDCQLFTEQVIKELLLNQNHNSDYLKKADELLDFLQLSDYKKNHPATLSGGQKQRLCIAVACMKNADVICFDEPTSGLDYLNMKKMTTLFKSISKDNKLIFVISHDYEFLVNCCTHILCLNGNSDEQVLRRLDEYKKGELLEGLK